MGCVKFTRFFIDNYSMGEILERVDDFIASGEPHQLVAVNAAKIVKMHHDPGLAGVINSCDVIFADGQAVVWASRFLGHPLKERVAGIDLMQEIVKHAANKGHKLYFLGAKQQVVKKLAGMCKEKFPDINIAGWHDGYFKAGDEEDALLKEIRALEPDILFVAMETPKKEYWIRDNFEYLRIPVCMGVGGSFDVITGFTKRAPEWMQRAGLEWFFRFLNEPGRMWKRYLFTNIAFIWIVLKAKIIDRKTKFIMQCIQKMTPYVFLTAFTLLPGQVLCEKEEDAWFPFCIPWSYCEGSKIDVSFLLDAPAGKYGFLNVKDGHFYFKNGKRAKFWGVNIHSSNACFPTHKQAEDIAKRLRQLGCNIVRMHLLDNEGPLGIIDGGYNDSQHFSGPQMEKLDYFIYQLKDKGIYISFEVLGLGARRFKAGDNVPEFDRIKSGAGGISFFNNRIIELSKKFAIDFLSHVNPYTGNSYLNEPAIAMVEMTNENTLFADWITAYFTPYYKKEINDIWLLWLKDKGRNSNGKWSGDREFMFELQDSYQKGMYNYLRSIGVKVPIGASNVPHDNLILAADSNMDFTDIHPYWDHVYKNNRIHNRPLIKQNPLNPYTIVNTISRAKVRDKPLIITEWDSMWPNDWRAVDILSTASYAALNDIDAMFLYAYNGGWEMSWDNLERKIYYPTVIFNDPASMGLFPLGALIFLRGDVRPALNTYSARYNLKTLFEMTDSYPDIEKLAGIMYVSKLEKVFYVPLPGDLEKTKIEYPSLPDSGKGLDKVVSDTGEIQSVFKNGIFILNTPRVISFSGFVGDKGSYYFNGVEFFSGSDFSTFTLASLDGRDIAQSNRLLLVVVGRARNKGQRFTPHESKKPDDLTRDVYIINKGAQPILVEPVNGEIFIKNNKRARIFSLDENGLRKSEIPINIDNNGVSFKISGIYNTIYYEIVKESRD